MAGAKKRGIHNMELLAKIVRLKGSGSFTWADIRSSLTDCPVLPPQKYIQSGLLEVRGIDPTDRKHVRKLWGVPEDIIRTQNFKLGSCRASLKSHAEALKDDPERLSTDFIKRLSKCNCKGKEVKSNAGQRL